MKKRTLFKYSILFAALFAIISITYTLTIVLPLSEISTLKNGYVSVRVVDSKPVYKITAKRPGNWIPLSLVSKEAYLAIQISEDWAFFSHRGVDLAQLRVAIYDSLFRGKPLRGASTITQQLVKNLFLTSEKSFWRKYKELILALYIDANLGKDKILETYLNIIEYGKGIYGIKSASSHYFNIYPSNLLAKEGAFLAMLLPSPEKYAHSFHVKELTPFAQSVISKILHKMTIAKYISKEYMGAEIDRPFRWEGESDSLIYLDGLL